MEDLQGAVTVADTRPEQGAGQRVVAPGKKAARPGVLAPDAITDGDGMLLGEAEERGKVGKMELTIGVREGDAVETRRLEAGAQCSAVAAVGHVAEQPHTGPASGLVKHDGSGVVVAAVINDKDFVLVG